MSTLKVNALQNTSGTTLNFIKQVVSTSTGLMQQARQRCLQMTQSRKTLREMNI